MNYFRTIHASKFLSSLHLLLLLPLLLLLLCNPTPVQSQTETTVTTFNNIGGKSKTRRATISENALVAKSIKVLSITPNVGTATGGTHGESRSTRTSTHY